MPEKSNFPDKRTIAGTMLKSALQKSIDSFRYPITFSKEDRLSHEITANTFTGDFTDFLSDEHLTYLKEIHLDPMQEVALRQFGRYHRDGKVHSRILNPTFHTLNRKPALTTIAFSTERQDDILVTLHTTYSLDKESPTFHQSLFTITHNNNWYYPIFYFSFPSPASQETLNKVFGESKAMSVGKGDRFDLAYGSNGELVNFQACGNFDSQNEQYFVYGWNGKFKNTPAPERAKANVAKMIYKAAAT